MPSTDAAGEVWSAYVAACARKPNIERQTLSVSQLAELLGFEPERFIGLQVNRQSKTVTLFLEPLVGGSLPGTACSDCNSLSGRLCDACAKRREYADKRNSPAVGQ